MQPSCLLRLRVCENTSKLKSDPYIIYRKVYNSLKPILVSGRGLTYIQKHDNHPPPPSHPITKMLLYPLLRSVSVRHIAIGFRVCRWCGSATFVGAVARSLSASPDRFLLDPPQVRSQTQEAHGVYEGGGEVELAAELTGGVVEGEGVMVVVEAFTWKQSRESLWWWSTRSQRKTDLNGLVLTVYSTFLVSKTLKALQLCHIHPFIQWWQRLQSPKSFTLDGTTSEPIFEVKFLGPRTRYVCSTGLGSLHRPSNPQTNTIQCRPKSEQYAWIVFISVLWCQHSSYGTLISAESPRYYLTRTFRITFWCRNMMVHFMFYLPLCLASHTNHQITLCFSLNNSYEVDPHPALCVLARIWEGIRYFGRTRRKNTAIISRISPNCRPTNAPSLVCLTLVRILSLSFHFNIQNLSVNEGVMLFLDLLSRSGQGSSKFFIPASLQMRNAWWRRWTVLAVWVTLAHITGLRCSDTQLRAACDP